MLRDRSPQEDLSRFLQYLAKRPNGHDRLPSLADLSRELGISIATLREQLEVARILGVVEVKPKTGIRKLPYNFKPVLQHSLKYAIAADPKSFGAFSDLRRHVETSYFHEAASRLGMDDIAHLRILVRQAQEKLHGNPIQIPHDEHRELHLVIYCRLGNSFVSGLLETYWELYEAIGLNVYTDYDYFNLVWQYHEKIVNSIAEGNYDQGFEALIDHMDLLQQRTRTQPPQRFE